MASLLTNSNLALWVWILIIVIGSLLFLGFIALLARFILLRRRRATFIDTFGDENLPQRRLTVRRGRVVPSSNYLSLTGSRFGFNTCGAEDNDTNSRATARSRSPFEWWNTVKDRSHSRSSQATQMTQVTNDTASILGASPSRHQIYQRSDATYSNISIASSSTKDGASTTVEEIEPTTPPESIRKPPNFSRSFSKRGYRDDFSPKQHTLSRIEEASPHTSMISTRHIRNTSHASHASHMGDTLLGTPSPPTQSYSPPIPQLSSFHQRAQSEHISSAHSSVYHDTLEAPTRSLDLSNLRRMHHESASSLPGLTIARASTLSNPENGISLTRPQSHITALPVTTDSTSLQYWNTRTDLQPIRANGKKGNVLRKKSLRRSELISQVGQ